MADCLPHTQRVLFYSALPGSFHHCPLILCCKSGFWGRGGGGGGFGGAGGGGGVVL